MSKAVCEDDWAQAGDLVTIDGTMQGIVQRVVKTNLPYATVMWSRTNTGRHSITLLRVIKRACPHCGMLPLLPPENVPLSILSTGDTVIPTIRDIVEGLVLKLYTAEQALGWIEQHMEAHYVELQREDERRQFAAMAMQGLSLNTNAYYETGPHNEQIAARAVALADALLAALDAPRVEQKT